MSRCKPHPKLLDVTPDPAVREPSRLATAAGLVAILLVSRAIVVLVALVVEANYAIAPGGSATVDASGNERVSPLQNGDVQTTFTEVLSSCWG